MAKSRDINRGGMGLGLTISKMIVFQLGGEINLISEFGKGSSFSFNIFLPENERSSDSRSPFLHDPGSFS